MTISHSARRKATHKLGWRKTAMACGLGLPVGREPAENALNALPPRWRRIPSAIKERAELPVHKNNKLIGIVFAVRTESGSLHFLVFK